MFLPIRTDSPLRTTPYVNYAMLVINVLVFVAQYVIAPAPGQQVWWTGLKLSASEPELLQFVTYGFLHADGWHIFGNMLFLYIFGNNVNDKMGQVGYLAFYIASVAFAGISYVTWDQYGNVIGASGGVAAVVGAYLILFPRAHVTVLVLFFLIGTYEIPSLWFVAAFFIKDVIGLGSGSGIAYSAHIGGTLFGVLVCVALLAMNLLPRDQFDVLALIKQWNRRRQYRDAVSSGWNPYGAGKTAAVGERRGWVQSEAPAVAPPDARQTQISMLRGQVHQLIADHDLSAAARGYVELKTLDPQQVLARQAQLDIANQFAQEQKFEQAAEAYETFLKHYPKYEQVEQVELMLGVVLNRFLNQPARAKEYLIRASAKLMDENTAKMARAELEKAERALNSQPTDLPPHAQPGSAV